MKVALVAIGVDIVARGVFWKRNCNHLFFENSGSDSCEDDYGDDDNDFDDNYNDDDNRKAESHPSSTRGTVVVAA